MVYGVKYCKNILIQSAVQKAVRLSTISYKYSCSMDESCFLGNVFRTLSFFSFG